MKIDLTGKKAIVCGSTQGIGRASAVVLAELGANITLIARNEVELQKTAASLPSKGQKHDYIVADFSQPEDLRRKVDAYISSNGPVHILVNNTGGPAGGPIVNG